MEKLIHKSNTRGFFDHGWLRTYHSFSFADYYNPEKMNFGLLRVLNDDVVEPGEGFGTHPHKNMEIVTIPLKGELEHQDSAGHKEVVKFNDIQNMSAGTGVYHSEYNASDKNIVSLLQIWVLPKELNIKPRYDQMTLNPQDRKNKINTFVSPETGKGKLWINQDAYFSMCDLEKGKTITYNIKTHGNGLYIFLIEGEIQTADENIFKRDGIGIWDINEVEVKAERNSQILFIEVPMKNHSD